MYEKLFPFLRHPQVIAKDKSEPFVHKQKASGAAGRP
jgi:hypothetical protein